MSLRNAKILLYAITVLTLLQYVRSQYAESFAYIYNTDKSMIPAFETDDSYYDRHKIAGGKYAKLGDFPYMAVVQRLLGNEYVGRCGGTILSKRWILTAGHCVANHSRGFFVVVGVINKSGIKYNELEGPGVGMITNRAILHPQYQIDRNDIALLFMPRDIPFSDTIRPVILAGYVYAYENFEDAEARVIGWGRDKVTSKGTVNLKYATLPIISRSECGRYWSISDKHICTAAGLGQAACQGDSGGPLIVAKKGKDVQVGIVSYGDGLCPSNLPGVFTRVSSYADWIHKITNI